MFKPGDDVVVLPSGLPSKIAAIETKDGPVDEAFAPMAVTIRLADEIDISRGDMICRPNNQPAVSQDVDAMVCWMGDEPMRPGGKYAIKHTTRTARTMVKDLRYRLDVNTLHRDEQADTLTLNEIGRLRLRVTAPLFTDPYRKQPDDRQLHPHRGGHERHRRRGHAALSRPAGRRPRSPLRVS